MIRSFHDDDHQLVKWKTGEDITEFVCDGSEEGASLFREPNWAFRGNDEAHLFYNRYGAAETQRFGRSMNWPINLRL